MPPQIDRVGLVVWLLKQSQAKYNQELKAFYQAALDEIEKALRGWLDNGHPNLTAGQFVDILAKIMAAKELTPPIPGYWDLVKSTLEDFTAGTVSLADLPLHVRRQIELSTLLSQSGNHGVHRSPLPSKSPTTSGGEEDTSDSPSSGYSVDDDASQISEERLAHLLAGITLPPSLDNSPGDGADNAAVDDAAVGDKSSSRASSNEGIDTPASSSSGSDTLRLQNDQHRGRQTFSDYDEELGNDFGGSDFDSDKENQSPKDEQPPQDDQPPQDEQPRTMRLPSGQVSAVLTQACACPNCGTIQRPTILGVYGGAEGGVPGVAMLVPINYPRVGSANRPGAATSSSVQVDTDAELPAMDKSDSDEESGPGDGSVNNSSDGTSSWVLVNTTELSDMDESDSDEKSNSQPSEQERPEYRTPTRPVRVGRAAVTSNGSPVQKSGSSSSNEDMGFGQVEGGGNGGAGMARARSLRGVRHEAPVMREQPRFIPNENSGFGQLGGRGRGCTYMYRGNILRPPFMRGRRPWMRNQPRSIPNKNTGFFGPHGGAGTGREDPHRGGIEMGNGGNPLLRGGIRPPFTFMRGLGPLGASVRGASVRGVGHGAPIPDLTGGDSLPTGSSDAPGKKRKRQDSTDEFN